MGSIPVDDKQFYSLALVTTQPVLHLICLKIGEVGNGVSYLSSLYCPDTNINKYKHKYCKAIHTVSIFINKPENSGHIIRLRNSMFTQHYLCTYKDLEMLEHRIAIVKYSSYYPVKLLKLYLTLF